VLKINCTKFYSKTSNGFKSLEVKYFSKGIILTNGKLHCYPNTKKIHNVFLHNPAAEMPSSRNKGISVDC